MNQIFKDDYILPRVQLKDSLIQNETEKFFNVLNKFVQTFEELYSYNGLIVIAEPGNGKTRLLKELQNQAERNSYKGFYIDLKSIEDSSIKSKIGSSNLNLESNHIVCLDALDEVKNDKIYDCILQIRNFKSEFPNVKLIISCRSYVFARFENLINELKLQLVEIKPFLPSNIHTYLSAHGIKTEDVDTILEHFNRNYQTEVINSPRILQILTKLTSKNGAEATLKMTKSELLEEFIYEKIREEDKDLKKNIELSKRVLEKIALTMEIYQSKEISKDELMTFFDDIDSNLSANFLQIISSPDESDRFLLPPTSDGKKIQFENAEFQEYLAAKEITRFGRTDQALFDLAIDKNTNEIYTSWGNTIKYVIELEPSILLPVIDFITKKGTGANYDLLNRILLSDKNSVDRLQDSIKTQVFERIFLLYQNIQWYLKYDLIDKLSLYFTDSTEEILKRYITSKNEVSVLNTLSLIEKLLLSNKTHNIDFWRKNLLKKLTASTESIKAHVITALVKFKDIELYKNNIDISTLSNSSKHNLLRACTEIDPNDVYTMDLIIDSVKNNNYSIYPSKSFADINSNNGIKYYLKKLIDDEMLLSTFKVHPPDELFLGMMIDNIGKVFDDNIKQLLTEIILLPTSYAESDNFINRLIKLVESKDGNYIFQLVKLIKDGNLYLNGIFKLNQIFSALLNPGNVEKFIIEMNINANYKNGLIQLFWYSFSQSTLEERKQVFELSKKYFQEDYSKIEKDIEEYRKTQKKHPTTYENFKHMLEPEPGKYITDIFRFYSSNKENLSADLTEDDKKRMRSLLDIWLKVDFSKVHVTITDTQGDRRSYSISDNIAIFSQALPLFTEFGIDLQQYRKLLIEYLPYAFGNDRNAYVFSVLGELSKQELDSWFNFYSKGKKDDAEEIFIHNFFDVCRKYHVTQALPKLKEIVLSNNNEHYRKREALELINIIEPDIKFYKKVFDNLKKVKNQDAEKSALLANKLLISTSSNYQKTAIKWRMDCISKKAIKHKPKYGPYDSFEFSHRNSELIHPLESVDNNAYQELYLNFLEEAIKIYKRSVDSRSYAVYMWNITVKYFENLKVHKSYFPLENFDKIILRYKKFHGFRILSGSAGALRIVYSNHLGKPYSYSEAIKMYNEIKAKTYSRINSTEDFIYMIEQIIEDDLKKWITKEGAYRFISRTVRQEDLIQKTLKTQFQYSLMKRGIRDCDIRREEQLLNDKRTDFVISYGFIGRVLIELKLCKNPQVKQKTYEKTLMQYIDGTNSDYGIYLIFQTSSNPTWAKIEPQVNKIYDKHIKAKKIKVIGLDCTKYVQTKRKIN